MYLQEKTYSTSAFHLQRTTPCPSVAGPSATLLFGRLHCWCVSTMAVVRPCKSTIDYTAGGYSPAGGPGAAVFPAPAGFVTPLSSRRSISEHTSLTRTKIGQCPLSRTHPCLADLSALPVFRRCWFPDAVVSSITPPACIADTCILRVFYSRVTRPCLAGVSGR